MRCNGDGCDLSHLSSLSLDECAHTRMGVICVTAFGESPSHAALDLEFWTITNCEKGTPMSKHTAKHHKKAAKDVRAARPLKRAHGKKPTRVKKAVTQQGHVLGKAAVEQQGLEPDVAELQLVDLEALGQEPESVADVVEIFEVEVVSDAEGNVRNDEPELTIEDIS